jgi:drug/metabolite transporter (DMT)-like permease
MFGLTQISGFTASLLLNLEGVFIAAISVVFFKENAAKRSWLALLCMTVAGVFLAWDPGQSRFNLLGPVLVALAMFVLGHR